MSSPVMLSIRQSYNNDKGLVVYTRTYYNDDQLIEIVEQCDKSGVVVQTWRRVFQHWFNRNDMHDVKVDHERRGWKTIEYNYR